MPDVTNYKNQNFENIFFKGYCSFSLYYDFSVNWMGNYETTKGGNNLIIFVRKLTGQSKNYLGHFAKKWPNFLSCLLVYHIHIVSHDYPRYYSFEMKLS